MLFFVLVLEGREHCYCGCLSPPPPPSSPGATRILALTPFLSSLPSIRPPSLPSPFLLPAGTTNQLLYLKKNLGRRVTARCIYDGGNIWTNFACNDLSGGSCKSHNNANAGNTCRDYGYEMTPFRSKNHYIEMANRWGQSSSYFIASNVFRTANGCGGCTGCPMRVQNGCGWQTFDGGNWWLRDSTLVYRALAVVMYCLHPSAPCH